MTGKAEPRWSARQRLVVLTFDTIESAIEWDAHPADVKPWLTMPLEWDVPTMALLTAARDVIDEWHDFVPYGPTAPAARVDALVERLRTAVHDLSQSGRLRVVS